MVRRQKLISMTDDHYEYATQMPNFSKWVRAKMDEHIQTENKKPKVAKYICNGCKAQRHFSAAYSRVKGNHFPITRGCSTMGCYSEMYRKDYYNEIYGEEE